MFLLQCADTQTHVANIYDKFIKWQLQISESNSNNMILIVIMQPNDACDSSENN